MESNLMDYDFNKDDEVLDVADSAHEDRDDDVRIGKKIAREKKYHAARVVTVSATPLDADLLPVAEIEQDNVEVRPELLRAVDFPTAKQQMNAALAAAKATFKLPPEPKVPSNDNFKPVVSWPLIDQLTRATFEPDRERRMKLIATARFIRELIDMARADLLGDEKDCEVQRAESGKVFFGQGMTLDRKKRTYDARNGEQGAERHDGPIRTAKKSLPIDNGINRDDLFSVRRIAAREELDVIIAGVGPLWPSLESVISDNATMTDVGKSLGAKGGRAPSVGTSRIRLAMTAAMEALSQRNEVKDEPRRAIPMPDKSRGSFYNQTRAGSVMKVAA